MRLNKGIFAGIILCLFITLMSGCIFLIVGGVGAVGGYAVTRDTIQGEYDKKYESAWKASIHVCQMLGTLVSRDSEKGVVEAVVDRAKVRIEITQITPLAVRLKVKARKGIFPRLGTAQNVFVKIVQQIM